MTGFSNPLNRSGNGSQRLPSIKSLLYRKWMLPVPTENPIQRELRYISFKLLYGLVILSHPRRRLVSVV